MTSKRQTVADRYGANMRESVTDTKADIEPVRSERKPQKTDNLVRMRDAFEVPLDMIALDPNQPREHFDEVEITDLARNIKARGILQPVIVRWDEPRSGWTLVAGERRYRAATRAGLAKIKATVYDGPLDDIFVIQLIENMARTDLRPVEKARAMQRLIDDRGWTQAMVAEELAVSKSQVSKLLKILDLPKEAQAKINAGELAASAAPDLAKADEVTVERAVKGGKTRSDIAHDASKNKPTRSRKSEVTYRVDGGLVVVRLDRPDATDDAFRAALESAMGQASR